MICWRVSLMQVSLKDKEVEVGKVKGERGGGWRVKSS